MTTNELLDAVRVRYNLRTDYQLAKFLKWNQQSVSRYRKGGTMDEAMCLKVAAVLELEPGVVLAAIAAERAKSPDVKSAWSTVAKRLAAVVLIGALGIGGALHNQNVQAGELAAPTTFSAGPEYTYAPKRRRRLLRRAAAALLALCRYIGVALALVAPGAAFAGGDWTGTDTAWEAGFLGVLSVDCVQTWKGSGADPAHFQEGNPFLPEHPSKGAIVATCAAVGVGHGLISYALPPEYRRGWQAGTIAVELIVVGRNYHAGVRISF